MMFCLLLFFCLYSRFLSENLISSLSPGVFRDLRQLQWLWVTHTCTHLINCIYFNYFGLEGANVLPEMGFSYHHSPGLTGRNSLHLFNFYLYTQTHPHSIRWNYCTFNVFIFVPGCWTITLWGSCLRRLSLGSSLWNICESNRFKHGKWCFLLDIFIKTMLLYFSIW